MYRPRAPRWLDWLALMATALLVLALVLSCAGAALGAR